MRKRACVPQAMRSENNFLRELVIASHLAESGSLLLFLLGALHRPGQQAHKLLDGSPASTYYLSIGMLGLQIPTTTSCLWRGS